jgi:hypothetical protein
MTDTRGLIINNSDAAPTLCMCISYSRNVLPPRSLARVASPKRTVGQFAFPIRLIILALLPAESESYS